MDTCEATHVVLSKINNLDPQNASKIMGHILVNFQDTELISLAASPDSVLHTLVLRLKHHLNLSSAPSLLNFIPKPLISTNPSSPNNPISLKSTPLLSHDSIQAGSVSKSSVLPPVMDDHQMGDYFSFLNETLMMDGDLVDSRPELGHNWHSLVNNGDINYHRRSHSASDAYFGYEEAGYKSCLYFAKGFCKNGSNCKFMHSALNDDSAKTMVGFPSKFDEGLEHDVINLKAALHHRLVAPSQVMAGPSPPYINFFMQQQKDLQRLQRNEFLAMVSTEKFKSSSRQIYLTFPAESTFKDEDVSEYFSKFGPVQDVRIPYKNKRMFGFVTFVHPETVRFILSKGNPHFICDSRVLVKPYKEKGKALDRRQQQLERGEFSLCLSPAGLDSKEPHDLHLGTRMLHNPNEILLRRKLEEQAELLKAIELQERRLMNFQLPDLKNNQIHQHRRSLSVQTSLPLPQIHGHISNVDLPPDSIKRDITGFSGNIISSSSLLEQQQEPLQEVDPTCIHITDSGNKKDSTESEITDLCNSVERALPDSLFASPTKAAEENLPNLSTSLASPTKLESQANSSDMAFH